MSKLIEMEEFSHLMATAYVITSECVKRTEPQEGVIVLEIDKDNLNMCLQQAKLREADDDFYSMLTFCIHESETKLTCLAFLLAHNLYHWLELKKSELQ